MKKIILQFIVFMWGALFLSAEEMISITGVDTNKLLLDGTVDVYVYLQSEDNTVYSRLGADDFILEESAGRESEWKTSSIERFQYNGFSQEEISILLLIDNSGSMYDSLDGRPESQPEKQRISYLVSALHDLFERTGEYKDNLSLYTFNTYLTQESGFTSDRGILTKSLGNINQPGKDESYTELYRAMNKGMEDLSRRKGRKVLILLTDGENYTYSENKKEPHPLWGNNLIDQEKLTDQFLRSGITLYTIFYARDEDRNLNTLSGRTGGQSFHAYSRSELIDAYLGIHERISKEFRLTYTPAVTTGREKLVRVESSQAESPVFSYVWEVFWGLPPNLPWWSYLILTVLAIVIILVIHRTPFERLYPFSHLEVLSPEDENSTILQLSGNKTLIAVSSQKTEIIHDSSKQSLGEDETDVTIIKEADNSYTLIADKEVLVNNQPVLRKTLNPGDVIRAEGTLIVFDEPEE